jgi:hypothetical protein
MALHAPNGPDDGARAHHDGAGVARGNHGIGFAVLHHAHGDHERRVFLRAHGNNGGFVHADAFARMHDTEVAFFRMRRQLLAEHGFIPHEDNLVVGIEARLYGPFDFHIRGGVRPHGVKSDAHGRISALVKNPTHHPLPSAGKGPKARNAPTPALRQGWKRHGISL